ncbi:hypothetical protein MLD38_009147 [Melastoma candidum]|uniref:Uncharacterized protein n=1 Tax=Melastoma candidum TaxID=119954 RepID=A0ACB9RYI3_9MYRT|nr:hypothetical protein MLD38_009147 [Melastoma candidum]
MESGLISVDWFSGDSRAYFLTHLHSDHTRGLSSSWNRGPLFCTRITAKLFPIKFPGFDLSLLRILDTSTWHCLSLPSPSSCTGHMLHVMPIDARHCPGSVMYLFRGEFGRVLCTGDFRWELTGEDAVEPREALLRALNGRRVDTVYLDNTYCHPSHDFPARLVAAEKVIDIILSHPNHDVIIGIDSLGKEDLLVYIAQKLNVKIWVWPERLQIMHLLGFDDIFTTRTSLTRVRAVPRYSFSADTIDALNSIHPTIGIMPSGMPWASKPYDKNQKVYDCRPDSSCSSFKRSGNEKASAIKPEQIDGSVKGAQRKLFSVPYSDHCSFAEIQALLRLIRPFNMEGIVSSSPCYVDPSYYSGFCDDKTETGRMNKEQGERNGRPARAILTKSSFKRSNYSNCYRRKEGKNNKLGTLGAYMSRLKAVRRFRRGAKIVDTISAS